MGRATRKTSGIVAFLCTAALVCGVTASPDEARADIGELERTGLHLSAGAGYVLSGTVGVLNRTQLDVPELQLGLHHRWHFVDVGVQLGYLFSGRFADPFETTRPRYGGQATLVVTARWRFANPGWGAAFMQLEMGAMLLEHTSEARRAFSDGDPGDFNRMSPELREGTFSAGFTIAASLGMLFHVVPGLDGVVQLRTLIGVSGVDSQVSGDLDYIVSAIVLSMGVEFGL